jgi:predicted TIM-barrel fold metal-dependent hydrolase
MIIDSHAHVILPVEKHIELMDEAGVDKTILFSTSMHPEVTKNLDEFEKELNKLYEIISGKRNPIDTRIASIKEQSEIINKYPSRFYGFGSVPVGLDYEKTASWIEEYVVKNRFIGLGEFSVATGQVKSLETVFQASHDFSNLPIWIHAFWPLDLNDIKEIFNLAKKYPNVPVIIGHLGGVNWLDVIKMTKETKNVYIDLSAFYSTVALGMTIKELPKKCLFSADLPYGDLVVSKFSIERVCKDKAVLVQVMGGNVEKLLNL